MNIFAALIERQAIPAAAMPKNKPAPARDDSRARKMDYLPTVPNPWTLTACQFEVLRLISIGLGNREVADRLGVSIKTVEAHIQALVGRMQARTGEQINRVRAAVLMDRFIRSQT